MIKNTIRRSGFGARTQPGFPLFSSFSQIIVLRWKKKKKSKSVMVINEKSEFKRLILFRLDHQISENKSLFDSYFKEYLN